jgi:hypothetical protein
MQDKIKKRANERKIMQLFKKKTPLKDHYFLKLSLSKAEKQKIQSFMIDDEEKRFFPQITFENAEKIFKGLSEKLEAEKTFLISKMELVLNQEGSISTEDELFLTDFEITRDYENVLKPLSEAMFNLMPFSAVPFEDKLNYLKEVFEAWQESTQLGGEHLPLLPDFEWDDEDYVEFIIPFYQNQDKAETQVEEFATNEPVEKIVSETHELEEKEISETSGASSVEMFETVTPSEKVIEEEELIKDSLPIVPLEEKIDFKPYSFTYFHLETASPDVFVPLSITEKIKTINKEIDQWNRESNTLQKSIFEQKMARFEVDKKNQLAMHLKNLDKRVELKNELVQTAVRKLQEALAFESKQAKDKEKLDLLEERKAYELRVATIKHESSLALDERMKQVQNESKNQVHNELLSMLSNETAQLQEFLQESLLNLQLEKKKEAEKVQQELKNLSESQQKAIEAYYKQSLALPLNIQLHTLVKSGEVNTQILTQEDTQQNNFKWALPKRDYVTISAEVEGENDESQNQKAASEENVQEYEGSTQDAMHVAIQQNIFDEGHVETQYQGTFQKTPEQSESKGSIISFFQHQYKQNPLLTVVAFVAVVAICLLSFSGGWVLFNNLAK